MTCRYIGSIYPVLYLFVGLASAQTVTLTSNVEQDGRQAACLGEEVTFTCMVTDGPSLRWIAEPFINTSDPITFVTSAAPEDIDMDNSGLFRAILINITQSGLFGNFTSELTVTASETLEGTVIQCLATAAILMSKTLTLAAPPSPPKQPTFSVSQYALNDFTVTVQWESPASDGGVGIDNYTLTAAGITAPLTVLSDETLMATLTVLYNEMHMVSITASNCAGESTASVVTIPEVGCGPPTPPPRGSLGDLTSSQEGAVVTFQCSPGLVPSQQMISVCVANGNWIPDPAELICRVDCGIPVIVNGSVNYTTTFEGSIATYQCDTGLIPEGVITAACMENGEWTPDPGCRLPADCGIPIIVDGSVNYTTTVEGSIATYQCDIGLIPVGVMTAMCMRNGEWAPDLARVGCRLPGQESSAKAVVIAVPVAVVGGVTMIVVVAIIWRKRRNSGAFTVKVAATEAALDSTHDYARVTISECTRSAGDPPDVAIIAEVEVTTATYADPSAIDRQEFPGTRDVYTVVDKTKKTHKPENHLPTYQPASEYAEVSGQLQPQNIEMKENVAYGLM